MTATSPAPREAEVLYAVRASVAALPGVCVWRNNTGVDLARGVRYGLGVGGADLVGLRCGRFFGLEVKRPAAGVRRAGRLDREQRFWAEAVRAAGGFVAVVHSAEEALAALERCSAGADR